MSRSKNDDEVALHNALCCDFEEKVNNIKSLVLNMDRLLFDYEDIFLNCEEEHVRHFALQLIGQIFYVIDRVKLLKTGQCVRPYQIRTEYLHISPDIFCSFEKQVRDQAKFPSGLKLSTCSYEGIRYFGSDKRKIAHRLMLDTARGDLDNLIIKYLGEVEVKLNVLYTRTDIINRNQFEVAVKSREFVKLVGKSKHVLLDTAVMKDEGTNIFESTVCRRQDIEDLCIPPMDGCDHYAWLTTRVATEEIKKLEVIAFVEKRKNNYVEQKDMAAKNIFLNVGSRKNGAKRLTPLSNQVTPSSQCGFQTTCETADSAESREFSKFSQYSGDDGNVRFMHNGSTPLAVSANSEQKKVCIESEVDNMDLTEYESEESDGMRKNRIRTLKRARQEAEEETERQEFGDFFVPDGQREEQHHDLSAFPLLKSSADKKGTKSSFLMDESKSSTSSESDLDSQDAEYNEEDDDDMMQYAVKRSPAKLTGLGSNTLELIEKSVEGHLKTGSKMVPKSSNKTSKALRGEDHGAVKVENPYDVPEVKYKPPMSYRKKTKGDYATNYVEQIEVHVHNKLYSKVVLMHPDGTSESMVIRTPEELKVVNQELDVSFISFLVSHTITIVGSEIALERCIIDYVLKKQRVNEMHPTDQQDISNWKEIFIKIELLIMDQVKTENDAKKETLDKAMTATFDLTENEFREARNALTLSDKISGSEQADAIRNLRNLAEEKHSAAKSLTMEMKALLDATFKTTCQKVNNAIHYIAMKVCVYWANINNCLDVIDAGLLEKYNTRFLKQDRLEKQLQSAQTNGRLLLTAEVCPDQVVVPDDTYKALVQEESQLVQIMSNDHAEALRSVIYSVKTDAADIVSLVDILWSKTPRTKLSTAVAVKKEGGDQKNKKKKKEEGVAEVQTSTAPVISNDAAPIVVDVNTAATGSSFSSVTSGANTGLPAAATAFSAGSNGWTQSHLSTNSDGKLAFSLNTGGEKQYQQAAGGAVANNNSAHNSTVTFSHLQSVVASYDVAIKALLSGIVVQNDCMCLEIDFKDKRLFIKNRLHLLRFLLINKANDIDDVVREFSEAEGIYDLLNCLFYVKVDGLDGSVILGDGYCFYRAIYQLYLRQAGGYSSVASDMKTSDRKVNSKSKEADSEEILAFVDFVERLPTMVKSEAKDTSFNADADLIRFKFYNDCDLLSVLLKKRPGASLMDTKMWGSQSAVSLINFNITGLEAISDKPTSVVEKLLAADPSCSKRNSRWTRFQASSLPITRSKVSRAQSTLSFQDLDQVVSVAFNPLLYTPGHFTAGAVVHKKQDAVTVPLLDDFHDLKKSFFAEAFKRVQILEDINSNVVEDLTLLFSILDKNPTDQAILPDVNLFDSESFVGRLNVQFPDSVRLKSDDVIDLSAESESNDTQEVAELKELIKFNKSKVDLLAAYNKMLRNILMNDNIN